MRLLIRSSAALLATLTLAVLGATASADCGAWPGIALADSAWGNAVPVGPRP